MGGDAPSSCPHLSILATQNHESSRHILDKYNKVIAVGYKVHEIDGAPPRKKRKIRMSQCGICSDALHRPLFCLNCSFTACWTGEHMKKHLSSARHDFAVDVKSGALFCLSCNDFVHHKVMEELFTQSTIKIEEKRTSFRSDKTVSRQSFKPWEADETERGLLSADFSPAKGQGLRGLLNLGQSCYLSVILQCFIHNPLLRNYFLSDKHPSRLCKNTNACVSCEMDKLFSEMYSSDVSPYGPAALMHSMWLTTTELSGYQQQDAHEFYLAALHQMHSSTRGSTLVSCNCIVHTTFQGSLLSEVKCGECGNFATAHDPILDVSLDLKGSGSTKSRAPLGRPDDNTLGACLRRFVKPEKLPHDYKCNNCHKTAGGAVKCLTFRKLPPVLVFHLKRFEHSGGALKIDTAVRFPSVLNMAPYTSGAAKMDRSSDSVDLREAGPEALYEYELCGVVNHEGAMNSGHYTNFARFNDDWYRFDDDKVIRTTLRACLNSRAYMCFYIKRRLEYRPYQRSSYVIAAEEKERRKLSQGIKLS